MMNPILFKSAKEKVVMTQNILIAMSYFELRGRG